jgi:hypothetical protein
MRLSAIGLVIALTLVPGAAFAQAPPPAGPGAPPPSASNPPPPPGAITREQFVQQRAEAAGRLFDAIDTNHLGYITRAQLRAWAAQRRAGVPPGPGGPPPGGPPQQQ